VVEVHGGIDVRRPEPETIAGTGAEAVGDREARVPVTIVATFRSSASMSTQSAGVETSASRMRAGR